MVGRHLLHRIGLRSGNNVLVSLQSVELVHGLSSQAGAWERCLSGASASTSSAGSGWSAALTGLGTTLQHSTVAGGSSCCLSSSAGTAAASGAARGTTLFTSAGTFARTFASAAVAASAATASAAAGAGAVSGSTSGAGAGVPWPWVDPSRPQVLPAAVRTGRRTPVPLSTALQQLLDPLTPGQRKSHSLEVFVRFGLDPRRSDHLVRGSVVLPYGTGKRVRIVVFAKGADADVAREEGVDIIGDEDLIAAIVSSEGAAIAFDRLIATPDFMRPLARAGKVLGPKGLMPNPKMGTLTSDVARAIRETRRGRLDYRLGRDGAVRAALGRAGMPAEQLAANICGLVASLLENKPKAVGGPPVAAAAGAAAGGAAAEAPGAAARIPPPGSLDGYVRTFLLKTTNSAPVAVSFESLLEAVGPYRQLVGAAAAAEAADGSSGAAAADQKPKP
ncbi:hypothetical protein HYH02_008673 [Chlamydomonas schloesseri]|uniref:CL1 n=1 Tax=Chlamydomonas schloesseri TaxID=2026947 RepID=A0A836B1U1_9CHLO|nr:hypothetical protein HYH02_008673 [Chlamydomonas schloesseri]|eukprot:KAG2445205.1 hypothetical protein HYH02_008673 [Chlamydomonas schloesseri]